MLSPRPILIWTNNVLKSFPDVPPTSVKQANMAASTDIILGTSASIAGILNEKHGPEHLQTLKTFTAALRDVEYRWGLGNLFMFYTEMGRISAVRLS